MGTDGSEVTSEKRKASEMTGSAMRARNVAEEEERAKMGCREWGRGRGWTAFHIVVTVVGGERKEAAGGGEGGRQRETKCGKANRNPARG